MHGGRVAYCVPGEDLVIEPPARRGADAPLQVSALRFGRLFGRARDLPASDGKELYDRLVALGLSMSDPEQSSQHDGGDSDIPAGYTYLGQFITHEITFDSTGNLLAAGQPFKGLRTPQIDLDSLYGKFRDGKFVQEELYDGAFLKVGETVKLPAVSKAFPNDLLREPDADPTKPGKALLGDERNEENLPLAQTHLAFIKFHNKVVKKLDGECHAGEGLFACARAQVIKHFQWIVLHDYLPRIVDAEVLDCVLRHGLRWFRPDGEGQLFMPLEFSAAAFRIGHSMVRSSYQWNERHSRKVLNGGVEDGFPASLLQLFKQTARSGDLGRTPRLSSDWVIDWRRFYDFTPLPDVPAVAGVNMAAKLDTNLKLKLSLIASRPGAPPPADPRLAQMQQAIAVRNLVRGFYVGLPTGEEAAEWVGETPLTPDEVAGGPHKELLSHRLLRGRTPLWYYILKEAEVQGRGNRLGRLGSRIVAETLVGLIKNSPHSILKEPGWRPTCGVRPGTTRYEMIDLLNFADDVDPVGTYYRENSIG